MSAPVPTTSDANHYHYTSGHNQQYSGDSSYTEGPNGTNAAANPLTNAAMGNSGAAVTPRQDFVSQVYAPEFFKFANPGPLGLISFALTTFVLGFYQCGVGYIIPYPQPRYPSSLERKQLQLTLSPLFIYQSSRS